MRTILLAFALLGFTFFSFGQESAFTYQGRLDENGAPASGIYDLRFSLYTVETGGSSINGTLEKTGVATSNGLFTVTLDFGSSVFDGTARWLQIAVATNGSPSFTDLTPRQPVTSAPYAIRAAIAGSVPPGAITGEMLASGSITATNLAPGSITPDKLATNSIGATQLSRRYLSGSVPYSALLLPGAFTAQSSDYNVTFSTPFNITPVITLTVETPHVALPEKGPVLITRRTTTNFSIKVSSAAVGVEIVSASTRTVPPSIAMVHGNPAVIGSGTIASSIGLVYSRSMDAHGTSWSSPVMISVGYPGAAKLLMADGQPAIAFRNSSGGISFVRASDANGTSWPVPGEIVNGATISVEQLAAGVSDQHPAVLFVNAGTNLYFLRAKDPAGTDWFSPALLLSTTNIIASIDLESIGGNPAYAFISSKAVYYAQATDAAGTTWPAPTIAVPDPDPGPYDGPAGHVSLLNTAGNFPAVGYVSQLGSTTPSLRVAFARANNSAGTVWEAPSAFTSLMGNVNAAFAMVGTAPMAAMVNNTGDLLFSSSFPVGFSYFFGTPIALEFGELACDIASVGNEPAIAFYGSDSLRFIRRNTAPPNSSINWIAVEP